MKKILKILAICLVAVCTGSCTKIWEDVWIEHIPRPVVEIDTITVPPWDETEIIMINNKKNNDIP